MDLLQGKRCMVWSFMGNARMYQALRDYGDRIDTVGIFTFEVDAAGEITETGTDISSLATYRNRWGHIKWLLTIMNHGYQSVFNALRENPAAKTKFLSEIVRIMAKYPWCAGVDIDLERGGGIENREASNILFRDIYNAVKAYNPAKLVNICLPGMTGVNQSVGGENWCVYADLAPYCDTAAIMTYGMSWAGSAPGPISPRSWLEGVYDYAVTAIRQDKIFFGFPTYGWQWQIYDKNENLGRAYRGTSLTYYAALYWMQGHLYQFADNQPLIPWVSFWDDYDKVPWGLLHVYDYMDGHAADNYTNPLVRETYNRMNYLTSYSKVQGAEFDGVAADRNGEADSRTGNITVSGGVTTIVDDTGEAVFNFNISQAGTYDVALRLVYPFWDKNTITVELDGNVTTLTENRLWWLYWRRTFWHGLTRTNLAAGTHTLKVRGSVAGVQFHGFRVCEHFNEQPTAGTADFTVKPRRFKDIHGNLVQPNNGFKLTSEVLRRAPDSALIWYEDFRDQNPLASSYWLTLNGSWKVWQNPESMAQRPYAQLEGSGQLAWNYAAFSDVHLRARIAFPSGGAGRGGVFCGDVFCCINIDTSRVELYQGDTLLGSFAADYAKTHDADIRTSPLMYTVAMRIRGSRVRVYSGTSNVLRFTANITPVTGCAGVQSDNHIKCELLRAGDAWTYEPYEAFDIELPGGSIQSFGRVRRNGVTWDDKYNVFKVNGDVEESATRSESISMDYDFEHSQIMPLTCGDDYPIKYIPHDINVWLSRLFLGDSDGFGIMYYQDVDSIVYWSNEAAYRWGLRGIALWSLGQEDLNLWKSMPKQI